VAVVDLVVQPGALCVPLFHPTHPDLLLRVQGRRICLLGLQ
jgi:hypothetical protein